MTPRAVKVGAFAPLTGPGLVPAGRHLAAGVKLAVEDVGAVELLLRDTAGSPERATSALRGLDAEGVAAVVGEFHSTVARPLAELARFLSMPFVCSSATLDALTSGDAPSVARLAPPQSHGWRVYADHLLAAGSERVVLALQPDEYWSSGAAVLEARMLERGARCTRIDVTDLPGPAVADRVARLDTRGAADALLLLAGYPEPSAGIVRAVRSDSRLGGVLIGDPAGRAEFVEWRVLLGGAGLGVPYLRYLPPELGELGASVARRLAGRLGEPPSFVALEGYDSVLVAAEALRIGGGHREGFGRALAEVRVRGTRGHIRLSRVPGVPVLQWVWPPVQVAAYPEASRGDRVAVLYDEY